MPRVAMKARTMRMAMMIHIVTIVEVMLGWKVTTA